MNKKQLSPSSARYTFIMMVLSLHYSFGLFADTSLDANKLASPLSVADSISQLSPSAPTDLQKIPAAKDQSDDVQKTDVTITSPRADAEKDKDSEEESKKDTYLNFENTDLINFINYIGELKKLNIILDRALQGVKISLSIRDPLTPEGAWNIFLTVLEMSGFAIIKADGNDKIITKPGMAVKGAFYKVIPKDKKLTQALPCFINVPAETLPDNDLEIRYVMFLQNIPVGDVRDLLISMLSQPSAVIDQREANGFIITDKSLNIKAAAKLLQELDQMGLQETVTVLKLRNANAIDVKNLLEALIQKTDSSALARLLGRTGEGSTDYFPQGTRIIAEERTNALILLGTTHAIDKIIQFIKEHVDTELQGAESPLHIYELKYTDAQQIVGILQDVTQAPGDFVPGQQAAKYGAIRGGVKFFKSMKFVIDGDSNRIVVSCTDKEDWKLLKKTIEDLDKPQPQVAIETFVVTISVNDVKELSGSLRNKFHGQIGKNIDFQSSGGGPDISLEGADGTGAVSLLGNMISQLVSEQGASVLTFGSPNNIWSVFKALKSQTNATLLSQPFITVTNKTSASITFGETRRVLDEEAGSTQGFTSAKALTALTIKPQINLDGLIRLDLNVQINEFTDNSGNNTENKALTTNVTVANGQVLVLGGFVKTKVTEAKNKTPLLGDIPVIGWLFKRQRRTVTKNYIFIFMSPTIIKPRSTPGMQLYTKMKMHDATDQIENAIETKRTIDPIHNWFFNPEQESYSHKVIDFANARYQPTTVDMVNDSYYGQTAGYNDKLSYLKNLETTIPEASLIEADHEMIVAHNAQPSQAIDSKEKQVARASQQASKKGGVQKNDTSRAGAQNKKSSLQNKREKLKALLGTSDPKPLKTDGSPKSSQKKKQVSRNEKRQALKKMLSARNAHTPEKRKMA